MTFDEALLWCNENEGVLPGATSDAEIDFLFKLGASWRRDGWPGWGAGMDRGSATTLLPATCYVSDSDNNRQNTDDMATNLTDQDSFIVKGKCLKFPTIQNCLAGSV